MTAVFRPIAELRRLDLLILRNVDLAKWNFDVHRAGGDENGLLLKLHAHDATLSLE